MSNVQIRNVPEELHRTLKSRAAISGLSLSDYLLRELGKVAQQPSLEEWLDRVAKLPRVALPESSADIVRDLRGPLGPAGETYDRPSDRVLQRSSGRLTEKGANAMRELRGRW